MARLVIGVPKRRDEMQRLTTRAAQKARDWKRLAELRLDRARGRRIVHFLHVGKTGGTAVKVALTSYTLRMLLCSTLIRELERCFRPGRN
ncbi:MAG: hypothetical protein JSV66_04840 [Trueperaceae bacterium]|nr:MAG: hypothetical protein JSV66_04840 [Trueperaceae bacterium]